MAETTGGSGGEGGAGGAGGSQVEGLIIAAQTQGVDEAAKSLDNLGAVTIKSVSSIERHSNAVKLNEESLSKLNPVVRSRIQALQDEWEAEQAAIKAQQDAIRVTEQRIEQGTRFQAKLEEMVATFGMSKVELLSYTAAQLGVTNQTKDLIDSYEKLTQAQITNSRQQKADIDAMNERAAAEERIKKIQQDRDVWEHEQRAKSTADYEAWWAKQLAIQDAGDAKMIAAEEAAAAQRIKIEQARDVQMNQLRQAEYSNYVSWWEKQVTLQDASDAKIIASEEARAAKEKEIQQQRDIWMNSQRQKERADYESWWGEQLAAQETALQKQLTLDINYGQKSLKQKIDTLQKIAAYQADPRTESSGVDLGAMFGQKALSDVSKLNDMIKQYNESLGAHGKKLQQTGEEASVWGKILANNQIRTQGLILAHEALQGRFTRLGGSLGVMAEYFSSAGISITAFAGVVMGVAAAAVGLFYEIGKGQTQLKELGNSLVRTNNYAGETAGGLDALAHSVGSLHGNFTEAYKAVNELTASGRFTSDQIRLISGAVVDLNHVMGADLNTTIKEFESLAVRSTMNSARGNLEVAMSLEKLDQKYHFVNATMMETIIALEKEGKFAEASQMAIHALADETKRAAEEGEANIGSIEKGWNGVLNVIHQIIQGIADIGKSNLEVREQKLVEVLQAELPHKLGTNDGPIETDESKLTKGQIDLLHQYYDIEDKLELQRKRTAVQAEERRKQSEADHVLIQRGIEDRTLLKKTDNELEDALQRNSEALTKIIDADPGYLSDPKNQKYEDDRVDAIIKAHTKKAQKAKDDGRKQDLTSELDHENALYNMAQKSADDQIKSIEKQYKSGTLLQEDAYEKEKAIRAQELVDAEKTEQAKLTILDKYKPKNVTDERETAKRIQAVKDEYAARKQAIDDAQAESDRVNDSQVYDKWINQIDKLGQAEVKKIQELTAKQIEHNAAIGKTKEQIDQEKEAKDQATTAELKNEADAIEALLLRKDIVNDTNRVYDDQEQRITKVYDAELSRIRNIIAARQDYAKSLTDGAILEAQASAQKKVDEQWKLTDKKIGDDLASAIVDGGGKGWKKMLRDMEVAFAKAVLQPIIAPIAAGFSSILNPNATQAGGTVGTSSSNLIGTANALSTGYKAVSGGFAGLNASIGGGIQSVGDFFGSSSLSQFGSGLSGSAGAASEAMGGAELTPAASYGAAAAPYVSLAAGAIGGHYVGEAISGQYGSQKTVNITQTIGTAIGAYMGGVTGAAIGSFIGGTVGGLLNRAFGMGDKNVTATGIRGTVSDSGTTGENYSTWHQDGGWFRSDKNGTNTSALDQATLNTFTTGLATMKSTVSDLADTLGVGNDALKDYSKSFDILLDPLKEVKGTAAEQAQIQAQNQQIAQANSQKIADFFKSVGDDMSTKLIPNISNFAQAGETASQTLERLNTTFKQTNALADMMGKTVEQVFGSSGLGSDAARETLVSLAGGLTNLNTMVSNYSQNYLTNAEKIAPVQKAVSDAMTSLGYASVTTRQQFKDLVNSLNLADPASAQLFVSLMQLQDAFATVTPAIDDTTLSVADAKSALQDAYKNEVDAINSTKDSLTSFIKTMRDLKSSLLLSDSSPLTPEQKYAQAKAQLEQTKTAAENGDADAQSQFQAAIQNFLDASKVVNASGDQYTKDFNDALAATDEVTKYAQKQIDIGQASLAALNAQVSGLIDINDSVKTVSQAIADLAAAMGPAGASVVSKSQVNALTSVYGSVLNRAPDAAGLSFWQDSMNKGTSIQDVTSQMSNSGEKKIDDLYESLFNRAPDQAGLQFWLNAYNNGMSINDISSQMQQSSEYSGTLTSNAPLASQSAPTVNTSGASSDVGVVSAIQGLQEQITQLTNSQTAALITATVKSTADSTDAIVDATYKSSTTGGTMRVVPA